MDKFLNKFVRITQKDNFRKSGIFVSHDTQFVYLEFLDKSIQGVSKDEIKFIEEIKEAR